MTARTDPEGAIAATAKRCSNWGRWGGDDVLGTLNFLDEAKRREGAALEFLLVAAPLPVTGAVGAPVNPIAVK